MAAGPKGGFKLISILSFRYLNQFSSRIEGGKGDRDTSPRSWEKGTKIVAGIAGGWLNCHYEHYRHHSPMHHCYPEQRPALLCLWISLAQKLSNKLKLDISYTRGLQPIHNHYNILPRVLWWRGKSAGLNSRAKLADLEISAPLLRSPNCAVLQQWLILQTTSSSSYLWLNLTLGN